MTRLTILNHIIDQVRRLSHDLIPAALEDLGLTDALRGLANEFETHLQAKFHLYIDAIDDLFPAATDVIIYRVFQEILTNIEKHSHAEQVVIDIRKTQRSGAF